MIFLLNVEIRRPGKDEVTELHEFFSIVITDTFMKEDIGHKLDDINDEIELKIKYLENDFESKGEKRYFLIAVSGDRVIGTIEYGPASDLIVQCTKKELQGLPEIGTVFVHPDFQGKGLGNQLLKAMYLSLQERRLEEFCLDSGYKRAQRIWIKKFGDPDYLLKDYWGEGFDHMIWKIALKGMITLEEETSSNTRAGSA
jgi:GNAT superfamily N-acetyltransferase